MNNSPNACITFSLIIFFFPYLCTRKQKVNMSQDLFKKITTTIRKERLYANIGLMREDITERFGITRHCLNDLLNAHADGMSFPQFINVIRMEEAYKLFTDHPEMTITEIARQVGFSAPNFREQFKRCYGVTPAEFRANLQTSTDDSNDIR